MTTAEEKQTIIVTFHRKDRRKDQSSDKVELTRKMVRADDRVLDVDLYDAPILVLSATKEEIVETLSQMMWYTGLPSASTALGIAGEVFRDRGLI